MKSLLTVRQEVASIRYKKGLDPLADAEIFERSGFYSAVVGLSGLADWQGLHQWCKQQFGKDHYTWTGSKFWFENEQDAVVFALRWG